MYPALAEAQAVGLNQVDRHGYSGMGRHISHQIEASGAVYGPRYDAFPRPIAML